MMALFEINLNILTFMFILFLHFITFKKITLCLFPQRPLTKSNKVLSSVELG